MEEEEMDIFEEEEEEEPESILLAKNGCATKEAIIHQLQALPDVINTKTKLIWEDRKKYDEHQLALKLAEQQMSIEVMNEMTPEGKKKYSNAELRQIETDSRLAQSKEYTSTKCAADKLKEDIDINNIQLEYFSNQFKSARAIALLIAGD